MTIAGTAELKSALNLTTTPTDAELALLAQVHNPVERAVCDHIGGRAGYEIEAGVRTEFYPRHIPGSRIDPNVIQYEPAGGRLHPVSPDASTELLLAHLPVRSIRNVWVDYNGYFGNQPGSFDADTLLDRTEYYLETEQAGLCMSGILRRTTSWPTTMGSIRVEYMSGYYRSELDGNRQGRSFVIDASPIKHAIVIQVVHEFKRIAIAAWRKPRIGHAMGPIQSEGMGAYRYNIAPVMMRNFMMNWSIDLVPAVVAMVQPYTNYGRMIV